MSYDFSIIFQVAGIAFVVICLTTILEAIGKKDFNVYIISIGTIIALGIFVYEVSGLISQVKSVFMRL
ncbi:MAG: stage III sporulation protein AC [Bacilli bacterium]